MTCTVTPTGIPPVARSRRTTSSPAPARPGVATATQLQGKELSYNNFNDTDAAFECVAEFAGPACVIVKHANPCGVALADAPREAYLKALACDPVSAFGGIVALNRPLDAAAAEAIVRIFTEVIIAPAASAEAIAIVAAKKNLRLLVAGGLPDPRSPGLTVRSVAGGLLVQDRDNGMVAPSDLKVVTKRAPTASRRSRWGWRTHGLAISTSRKASTPRPSNPINAH